MLHNRVLQIKLVKEDEEPTQVKPYHQMPARKEEEEPTSNIQQTTMNIMFSATACVVSGFTLCRVVHAVCNITERKIAGPFL